MVHFKPNKKVSKNQSLKDKNCDSSSSQNDNKSTFGDENEFKNDINNIFDDKKCGSVIEETHEIQKEIEITNNNKIKNHTEIKNNSEITIRNYLEIDSNLQKLENQIENSLISNLDNIPKMGTFGISKNGDTEKVSSNKLQPDLIQEMLCDFNKDSIEEDFLKNNISEYDLLKDKIAQCDALKDNITQCDELKHNLTPCDLLKNNLTQCDFTKNNKTESDSLKNNLTESDLLENNLEQCDSLKNNLTESDLLENNLEQCDLLENNLTQCGLLENNLEQCNLLENNFDECNFNTNQSFQDFFSENQKLIDHTESGFKFINLLKNTKSDSKNEDSISIDCEDKTQDYGLIKGLNSKKDCNDYTNKSDIQTESSAKYPLVDTDTDSLFEHIFTENSEKKHVEDSLIEHFKKQNDDKKFMTDFIIDEFGQQKPAENSLIELQKQQNEYKKIKPDFIIDEFGQQKYTENSFKENFVQENEDKKFMPDFIIDEFGQQKPAENSSIELQNQQKDDKFFDSTLLIENSAYQFRSCFSGNLNENGKKSASSLFDNQQAIINKNYNVTPVEPVKCVVDLNLNDTIIPIENTQVYDEIVSEKETQIENKFILEKNTQIYDENVSEKGVQNENQIYTERCIQNDREIVSEKGIQIENKFVSEKGAQNEGEIYTKRCIQDENEICTEKNKQILNKLEIEDEKISQDENITENEQKYIKYGEYLEVKNGIEYRFNIKSNLKLVDSSDSFSDSKESESNKSVYELDLQKEESKIEKNMFCDTKDKINNREIKIKEVKRHEENCHLNDTIIENQQENNLLENQNVETFIENQQEETFIENVKVETFIENKKENNLLEKQKENYLLENQQENNLLENQKVETFIENHQEEAFIENQSGETFIENQRVETFIENQKESNILEKQKENHPLENQKVEKSENTTHLENSFISLENQNIVTEQIDLEYDKNTSGMKDQKNNINDKISTQKDLIETEKLPSDKSDKLKAQIVNLSSENGEKKTIEFRQDSVEIKTDNKLKTSNNDKNIVNDREKEQANPNNPDCNTNPTFKITNSMRLNKSQSDAESKVLNPIEDNSFTTNISNADMSSKNGLVTLDLIIPQNITSNEPILSLENKDVALKYFEQSKKEAQNHLSILNYNLATIKFNEKLYEEAIHFYNESLQQSPMDQALLGIILSYYKQGDLFNAWKLRKDIQATCKEIFEIEKAVENCKINEFIKKRKSYDIIREVSRVLGNKEIMDYKPMKEEAFMSLDLLEEDSTSNIGNNTRSFNTNKVNDCSSMKEHRSNNSDSSNHNSSSNNIEKTNYNINTSSYGSANNMNDSLVSSVKYTKICLTDNFLSYILNIFLSDSLLNPDIILCILLTGYECFFASDNCISINSGEKEVIIFGDTHGQFKDTFNTIISIDGNSFKNNKLTLSDKIYVFNGDYVDRGKQSIQNFLFLLLLKLIYPKNIFLNRGNHEYYLVNSIHGFLNEIKSKYQTNAEILMLSFNLVFSVLPLCIVLNNKIFITHGGLPKKQFSIKEIDNVNRKTIYQIENEIINGLMWSDPGEIMDHGVSRRGTGIVFGLNITETFLKNNNLKMIVRSHEYCNMGYRLNHGNRVITIFSAPNYCNLNGRAAYMHFKNDAKIEIDKDTRFDFVEMIQKI